MPYRKHSRAHSKERTRRYHDAPRTKRYYDERQLEDYDARPHVRQGSYQPHEFNVRYSGPQESAPPRPRAREQDPLPKVYEYQETIRVYNQARRPTDEPNRPHDARTSGRSYHPNDRDYRGQDPPRNIPTRGRLSDAYDRPQQSSVSYDERPWAPGQKLTARERMIAHYWIDLAAARFRAIDMERTERRRARRAVRTRVQSWREEVEDAQTLPEEDGEEGNEKEGDADEGDEYEVARAMVLYSLRTELTEEL